MTVKRRRDVQTTHVIQHRIADIRGGVGVAVSELGDDFLAEGTVLSTLEDDGLSHVVKIGRLYAAAAATEDTTATYKIEKLSQFKVGDTVYSPDATTTTTISAIDRSNKNYDAITVGQTLGALSKGAFILEAANSSEPSLKYTPLAIAGTGKPIFSDGNLDEDAWVIAVTKGLTLPDVVAESLKGIINY